MPAIAGEVRATERTNYGLSVDDDAEMSALGVEVVEEAQPKVAEPGPLPIRKEEKDSSDVLLPALPTPRRREPTVKPLADEELPSTERMVPVPIEAPTPTPRSSTTEPDAGDTSFTHGLGFGHQKKARIVGTPQAGEPVPASDPNGLQPIPALPPTTGALQTQPPRNDVATPPPPRVAGQFSRPGGQGRITGVYAGGEVVPPYEVPRDVAATPLPHPSDGLDGNRQVSLTPFPNLYMQSGPLSMQQLPWYHQLPEETPYTFLNTIEYDSLLGAMKSNGVDNSQGGWYNSLQAAIPFWTERQVGMQFGVGYEPNMLQTNYYRFTGGFFRRAIWPLDADIIPGLFQRISTGTVYDGIYDGEHRAYMGQMRSQMGFALSPQREVGGWFAMPMQGTATNVGPNAPLTIDTTTNFYFYYRQTFPSEVDATIFSGWAEGPGGMNVGTYLSYHFAQQASLICWGMFNFEAAGANAIYFGLRFHFAPHEDYTLISGNPQNRYRPYLKMADPIQLQLRKSIAIVP